MLKGDVKVIFKLPAHFLQFAALKGIAEVVPFSIFNVFNCRFIFFKHLKKAITDLEVGKCISAVYIINFSASSVMKNKIYCRAMIFNIDPVTNVRTCAINGNYSPSIKLLMVIGYLILVKCF